MNHYNLQNSHANIGMKGAFLFGRIYHSGITLSVEPTLNISSVQRTTFYHEYFSPERGKIVYISEVYDQHRFANFQLPATLDFNLGKTLSVGASFLFSIPFAGSGTYGHYEKRLNYKFDFYETSSHEYEYRPRAELGLGFSTRVLFAIASDEDKKQFIGLSYFHEINPRYPAGVNDKAFTLSFITRNIATKEILSKWDRLLLKYQKS
jgi:hypothetical protein